MRQFSLFLLAIVFTYPFPLIAQNSEPIRVCVAMLENRSHSAVTPDWQQKELVRALDRTNKNKDVKKGSEARIMPVALDSTNDLDTAMQRHDCGYVLYTQLVDVHSDGTGRMTQPGAAGTGVTIGKVDEPPDMRRLLHDATVNYRIMQRGSLHSLSSGIVTEKDTITEDALVSRLMDQIATRAAHELRNPQPSIPE